ncbi:MAG: prepilin-type N-terminal cleavage/methylation domain-containing protein [Deltaproteobacteria bacterium]|nr:prepilin-type N-terminal cleavage/methylation domain-containing protein [Deltaproteobacteria bacterium]
MSREKLRTPIVSKRSERGLTLIEAMVALGVLAYGILGVALLQDAALKRSSASRYSFGAAQIAKSQISIIRRVPWSALPETAGGGANWEDLCDTVSAGGACNGGGAGSGYPDAMPATLPQIPVEILTANAAGAALIETLITFNVQWRVQDVPGPFPASPQCRKDIFLRVSWQESPSFPEREVFLSTRIFNAVGDRNADPVGDLGLVGASASEGC